MTDYKFNTYIEWTEEDRKRGECPVPAGSDVTVWLSDRDIRRDKEPEGWDWRECVTPITAYMIHSIPREPREWYVAKCEDFDIEVWVHDSMDEAQSFVNYMAPENWEIIKVREVMEDDES